jgi:hypothetical protein
MEKKVAAWRIVLEFEDGSQGEFGTDIPADVSDGVDKLIADKYPAEWEEQNYENCN